MIENDMLVRVQPAVCLGELAHYNRKECIITKEEFIACYNAWIKQEGNDNERVR